MTEQLAESHYLMLANIEKLPLACNHPTLDDANIMGIVETLQGCKYVFTIHGAWEGILKYKITEIGRQALAAYKAQRDLVLFIAEFEEWLEEGVVRYGNTATIKLSDVLAQYRACKERITNVK